MSARMPLSQAYVPAVICLWSAALALCAASLAVAQEAMPPALDDGDASATPLQEDTAEDAAMPEEAMDDEAEASDEAEPCSPEEMAKLKKKVATAYKGVFYDNDFSYLCDPCYCDWHLGEHLKRICLGHGGVLDLGGEYRTRYHGEHNMRGPLFLGRDDDFLLHRWRLYANWEVTENVRAYVEYLDATSNFEDFPPRPIEENRSDLLNAFVDAKLLDDCGHGTLTARVGRQELLYGEQRLISPLDWANTRRTFEGAKAFWVKDNWRADAFWVRPVLPDVHNFDEADENQEFYGLWATHKDGDTRTLDLYWLGRHDYDSPYAAGRYPLKR